MTKVKGTNTDGKIVTLEKTRPQQLSLFGSFLPNNEKYSNTIDLYDAIPKYFASTQHMAARREGGKYLPTLERRFRHKGQDYTITIAPARLKDKEGRDKEYYPTEREELVEEALKKLACDQLNGVYLDNFAGVQFTLYELRQELKHRGHSISFPSLIEALNICSGTHLVLQKAGKTVLRSPIFPTLLITSREEWLANPKTARCYVQFNSLVTRSINHLTYRQFDYGTFMAHTRQLTRWLHKRLSHNYLQADWTNTYDITLTAIIRDSGLLNARRMNDNLRQAETSLQELRDRDILLGFTKDILRGSRNKIAEVKYALTPDPAFVDEVKKANKRNILNVQQAETMGILDHDPGDVT